MARANAGPRRVPRRRSRARHRPVRRTSAGHQRTASLAPTLGAARTMEGPAAAPPIESGGSEDPERLRPALHLELLSPLLGRGNRHQAARAHGMGSGIKEPDPCPGRIKTGHVVLDANRADGGVGGDGRIRRGQPNQAPVSDVNQVDQRRQSG